MPAYEYLTTTGTIIPDTADLKAEVQAEFRAALGADLSLDDETPQGVLIVGEVQSRSAAAANNAALANQINPDVSGGVFLDALCALLGLQRAAATFTAVSGVTLTGVPGTVIPTGTRARTAAGDVFALVSTVTLGGGGTATGDFRAVEAGPVPCLVGQLSQIVDGVLGWETVTNPVAGVPGTDLQSDESLRSLRRVTLALQGQGTTEAITSRLFALDGVRSLTIRVNKTDTTAVIDGVSVRYHSVWTCVDGGTDADIAVALLAAVDTGGGFSGSVVVNVTDPWSGQVYPVQFERPTAIPVLLRVTVRRGLFVGPVTETVQDAVAAYAAGELPSERGFVVGAAVSPFEVAGAVSVRAPGLFVAKVEVAPASTGVYQTDELPIAIDEIATVTTSSITVIEL
jgi:uncharacterized phage protein gp47/JayE